MSENKNRPTTIFDIARMYGFVPIRYSHSRSQRITHLSCRECGYVLPAYANKAQADHYHSHHRRSPKKSEDTNG